MTLTDLADFLTIPALAQLTLVAYLIRRIKFPTDIGGREAGPE